MYYISLSSFIKGSKKRISYFILIHLLVRPVVGSDWGNDTLKGTLIEMETTAMPFMHIALSMISKPGKYLNSIPRNFLNNSMKK